MSLGKLVTAAGGAIIAVFGLIGWIVALTQDLPKGMGTMKVHATFQGLILIVFGVLIVLHALLLAPQNSKGSCLLGLFALFLACPLGVAEELTKLGGMNFYMVLGALVAILGANWDACGCKFGGKADAAAAPGPESKL